VEVAGYTKLFSSILMSSIWEESTETRLVWVTLLALADQNGHVDGTVKSLARVSRVSLEDCQKALDCLLGPDPFDRSGVMDGRRIVAENGGWTLVNHAAYRAKMSADERRARDKERKREKRGVSAERPRRPQASEFVRDVSQAEAEQKQNRTEQTQNTAKSAPAAHRGGLLLSPNDLERLHRYNAYVGARLRVPTKLHGDFMAALGGQDSDARLRGWYAEVDAEIEASGEAIVPDVWKWLEARFRPWALDRATAEVRAQTAEDDAEYRAMRARVIAEQDALAAAQRDKFAKGGVDALPPVHRP